MQYASECVALVNSWINVLSHLQTPFGLNEQPDGTQAENEYLPYWTKKNNQIQTVSMMTNYKSLTWNCKESLHVFFGWIWPLCENQSCFNMRTIFAAFVRRTPVGMHMFQSHGVGHAHMRAWTFQSTNARIAVRCVQDHAHEVVSVNDAQRRTTCPMKFLNTTNLTCCWQWGTIKSWRKSACRHQRWRTTLAPAFSGFNCCQWK